MNSTLSTSTLLRSSETYFAEIDGKHHEIGSSRQQSGTLDGETVCYLNRGSILQKPAGSALQIMIADCNDCNCLAAGQGTYLGLSLLGHALCVQEERLRSDRQRSPHIRNLRNEAYGNRRVYKRTPVWMDVVPPVPRIPLRVCCVFLSVCVQNIPRSDVEQSRAFLLRHYYTSVLYFLTFDSQSVQLLYTAQLYPTAGAV